MVTLLQRPPLAMFDPSLIHRNDEIFNPEPNRLGIFFALHFGAIIAYFKVPMARKSSVAVRLLSDARHCQFWRPAKGHDGPS